jgi:hypothetical protein
VHRAPLQGERRPAQILTGHFFKLVVLLHSAQAGESQPARRTPVGGARLPLRVTMVTMVDGMVPGMVQQGGDCSGQLLRGEKEVSTRDGYAVFKLHVVGTAAGKRYRLLVRPASSVVANAFPALRAQTVAFEAAATGSA